MKCVRCSSSLKPVNYEGVEVDRCEKCHGTWLDEGELLNIVTSKEEKFDSDLIERAVTAVFAGIPTEEKRSLERCPKCLKPMRAMNYAYQSGVIIDRCPDAHGIWLDGEELEKIQAVREHWDLEMKGNRDEWIGLIRKLDEGHELAKGKEAKELMRPTKFLVHSLLGKLFR